MKVPPPGQVTQILQAINSGDRRSIDELFVLVYDQLRKMAKSRMAREPRQTLQTTGLVHEVYLRLLQDQKPRWENRRHFFSVAAEAMRRILVENARRRSRLKRGGGVQKITFRESMFSTSSDPHLFLTFDQALSRLQDQNPMSADIVKLRYFAGLTLQETALALGMSSRNVDRHWAAAKAWLYKEVVDTGE